MTDQDVLARTVWGEARNQCDDGMQAIANVVMNRLAVSNARGGEFWWGTTVSGICLKPFQFSCWNRNDPNRSKILAVTIADPIFATAIDLAEDAISGDLPDITCGATSYHTADCHPLWDDNVLPVKQIGAHVFYKPLN